MSIADTEAFEAMLAHHRSLEDQVARRVAALRSTVDSDAPYEPAAAELVAYLASEVLPHALAEERSVYQAASALLGLAGAVEEMIGEHRQLEASIETLASSPGPVEAAVLAESIGALFSRHVAKENDLLLPPLLADETVSLSQLLVQMHGLTEAAQRQAPATAGVTEPDAEASLLALLLEATGLLAEAGQGDRACRLVAQSWATLRSPRPELAVRVTAALHQLVRSVTAEPIGFTSRRPAGRTGGAQTLDVRELAPAQRHEAIFAAYDALAAGQGFVLVNDHDPKPLRYQLEAEHAGDFTWETLEAGPRVWRVRIGHLAGSHDKA